MIGAGMLTYSAAGRVLCTRTLVVGGYGGTPIGTQGRLAITTSGVFPSLYLAGLPYIAGGQLSNTLDAGPSHYSQGFAYVSSGGLALDTTAPITHYVAGLPRTATGAIAVDPTIP